MNGDLELGATGTVTEVDGNRVYAFGHPFYGLGPTQFPMTRAHVITVLPSLASSMKIASTGDVIGTVQQDRATTIAGTLGPGPVDDPDHAHAQLRARHAQDVQRSASSTISCSRRCSPTSSILNTLTSYERQNGVGSYTLKGAARVKNHGDVAFEDLFTGDQPSIGAAASVVAPINLLLRNAFEDVEFEGLNLEIDASEQPRSATLERVWIDGTQRKAGSTGRPRRSCCGPTAAKKSRSRCPFRFRRTRAAASRSWWPTATRLSQLEARELQVQPLQTTRSAADDSRAQQRAQEQPPLRPARHARRRRRRQGRAARGAAAVGAGGDGIGSQRRQLPAAAERARSASGRSRPATPSPARARSRFRSKSKSTSKVEVQSKLQTWCLASPSRLLLLFATVTVALPSTPTFWQVSTESEFLRGEVENLSIDSFGRLTLGPTAAPVYETNAPFLWTMVSAPDGSVYAGSGNEGQVYRSTRRARARVFFDSRRTRSPRARAGARRRPLRRHLAGRQDLQGRCERDRAACSSIPPTATSGASQSIKAGNVFAATGDKGIIYKITPDGKGTPFYADEGDARDVARVRPRRAPARRHRIARPRVPDRRVRASRSSCSTRATTRSTRCAWTVDGNIYAAAVSGRGRRQATADPHRRLGARTGAHSTPNVSTEITVVAVGDAVVTTSPQARACAIRTRRRSACRCALSASCRTARGICCGSRARTRRTTSPFERRRHRARGHRQRGQDLSASPAIPSSRRLIARANAQQVTALLHQSRRTRALRDVEPGQAAAAVAARADRGTYTSDVRDAQTVALWGTIKWQALDTGGQPARDLDPLREHAHARRNVERLEPGRTPIQKAARSPARERATCSGARR